MGSVLYTPLTGEKEIRTVVLLAGQPSDPLQCRLQRVDLTTSLDFQALSYEWKQTQGHVQLRCDGHTLSVTPNLTDALRSLRHVHQARTLWIDAICINQADLEERGRRVRLMHDIYASAESVLVWLGLGFEGVAEAFEVFPYLARVAVERHPTGKPDTVTTSDMVGTFILERPAQGSILQSRAASVYTRHDRDSAFATVIPECTHLTDDEIFHFADVHVWNAIDHLFTNSYFYRSWIIQEIAVAEGVTIICGSHTISWDIFHVAYEGRWMLRFQPDHRPSNVMCVRDARRRYRSRVAGVNNHSLDLGVILTSFTYSRESDTRDRIYAAVGMILPPQVRQDVVPDYNKFVSDVFREAARHIILQRQDLYLWSSKSVRRSRSMRDLPSWVPEWTMAPCEEALDFASSAFCDCVSGHYEIRGRILFVNGHLLDQVDKVFRFHSFSSTLYTVAGLGDWLQARGKGLFDEYRAPCSGSTHDSSQALRLQDSRSEAHAYLTDHAVCSSSVMQVLHALGTDKCTADSKQLLNIEAMWLTLTSAWYRRHGSTQHESHHLLLSMLFRWSLCLRRRRPPSPLRGMPKRYRLWLLLALLLQSTGNRSSAAYAAFSHHAHRETPAGYLEDAFFVTKNGYFGSAPAESVRSGHFVAILGGAYVPWLLEQHGHEYELVSHTYVEGIMTMSRLSPRSHVRQIALK